MAAPLHVIILAAGEGKRMKSAVPKVLQKIAGRPMLAQVVDTARALQPAGILLSPDGRHLFVGLRVCDEILVLRIGENGRLTQTARMPSGGKTPRDFSFSPSGRHLVVANQDSDRLTVFGVDHAAGTLSEPLQHFDIGTPMSIKLAAY